MANHKNPISLMLSDRGNGWEYMAILGTDKKYNRSAYKMYLHRLKGKGHKGGGEWWCFEDSIPMVTARSEAPARCYVEPLNHVRGPIARFPDWLACDESKPGLSAAVQACRELSDYIGVQS